MSNNEEEIWKALPGVTGVEVSNFGRVRTIDRVVSGENGTRSLKGHVLKQCKNIDGYLTVSIQIDGKQATKRVHRLVAQTFIKNPDNLPQVNHKDCDRTNNHVENLEFCDNSYNQKYKNKFGISNTETQGHPLFAINLSTLEVLHFRSQGEAGRELGISTGNINNIIKGRYKQTHGFWFVNDGGHDVDILKNRAPYKGKRLEDLEKARWYLDKLIDSIEN